MENFYTTVQTSSGQIVNGATVTVYDAGSGLPATIYEPDGVTPLANPFLSGYARSEGEIEFGAANGQYNIQIVNGAETDWIYRVTLIDAAGASLGALAYENDASGVPITDSGGYYASTDVEGALQEAGADLATHISNPTGAHAASAISVVDAGTFYTSTDVEGALQEAAQFAPNYAYFTETRNTASPNGTIPVHQWAVSGAETNIDAAFAPKGTGAILAQVPDGTATGGNKRGQYAVDWQILMNVATQVASGNNSVISGGSYNTASGSNSTVSGGSSNVSSGLDSSIGGGQSNQATGSHSCVPGGLANQATGQYSFSYGSSNVSSGIAAYTLGTNNTASGDYSLCTGTRTTDRGLTFRTVNSAGRFSIDGDAQEAKQVVRYITTDATPTILTTNSVPPTSTTVSVIPDNHAYAITARVIGRDTTTGDVYHVVVEGTAKRGSGAATTALDGTPSYTTISQSAGASGWVVELVANTTRGSAEIQVTGETGTTIHWVCKFETVEVG